MFAPLFKDLYKLCKVYSDLAMVVSLLSGQIKKWTLYLRETS